MGNVQEVIELKKEIQDLKNQVNTYREALQKANKNNSKLIEADDGLVCSCKDPLKFKNNSTATGELCYNCSGY